MAACIENVLKKTRSEILACLRLKGRLTVEELADSVGVSKVCIRRHLDLLSRDELIAFDVRRQDRGRPSHVYYLTAKSEGLFPTGYLSFAQGMLKQIGKQFGEQAIQTILAGYTEDAINALRCDLEQECCEDRIQGFVTLLSRSGYEANASLLENGGYLIEQRNCPMRGLASQYPQICDEELRAYQAVLGAGVARECQIINGFSSCIYKVFSQEQRLDPDLNQEVLLER